MDKFQEHNSYIAINGRFVTLSTTPLSQFYDKARQCISIISSSIVPYHLSSPSQLFFSLGPVGPSSLDSSLGILFSMLSALHLSRGGRRPTIHSIRFLDLYTTVGPHSRMNCSHCGSTTAPSPRYSAATMRYLALESTNRLLRAASLRMPIPSAAEPCRYTPGYA